MKSEKTILIVDDDAAHLKMLTAVLMDQDYQISRACNGEEAIAAVEEQFFDLILMDIHMPKVSGLETLVEIKSYNLNIPVILMSAFATVEYVAEAQKRGAIDFLTKPLDLDDIMNSINKALAQKGL